MPKLQPRPDQSPRTLVARRDQPLIGVVVQAGDREEVHYFTDEAAADAALGQGTPRPPIKLAGAWGDLDDGHALDELDGSRHESRPTPPITEP